MSSINNTKKKSKKCKLKIGQKVRTQIVDRELKRVAPSSRKCSLFPIKNYNGCSI